MHLSIAPLPPAKCLLSTQQPLRCIHLGRLDLASFTTYSPLWHLRLLMIGFLVRGRRKIGRAIKVTMRTIPLFPLGTECEAARLRWAIKRHNHETHPTDLLIRADRFDGAQRNAARITATQCSVGLPRVIQVIMNGVPHLSRTFRVLSQQATNRVFPCRPMADMYHNVK